MPSFQAKLLKQFLRLPIIGLSDKPIEQQRARQEASMKYMPLPKSAGFDPVDVNGIPSEWITTPDSNQGVILYLHGGAYALGSVAVHREMIARLVCSTQRKALAINYRLAPENPFPAALDDALSAYRWLLEQGFPPAKIVIAGDSAGGGLTLATLLALRTAGLPLPSSAICFSPWFDLALSGTSVRTKAAADPVLDPSLLDWFARIYATNHPLTHPLISPLYADLHGLPPILIQVGSEEILLDDSVRFAENVRNAGGNVTLQTWDGLFHVFQLFSFVPESIHAFEQATAFLSSELGR